MLCVDPIYNKCYIFNKLWDCRSTNHCSTSMGKELHILNRKQLHVINNWMSNTLHAGDRGSMPGRNGPNSLKQVVRAPIPNAWQQKWVSQVLGNDHYKGLARVTVGVACKRTLTAQRPWEPNEWNVYILEWDEKHHKNKQTNKSRKELGNHQIITNYVISIKSSTLSKNVYLITGVVMNPTLVQGYLQFNDKSCQEICTYDKIKWPVSPESVFSCVSRPSP